MIYSPYISSDIERREFEHRENEASGVFCAEAKLLSKMETGTKISKLEENYKNINDQIDIHKSQIQDIEHDLFECGTSESGRCCRTYYKCIMGAGTIVMWVIIYCKAFGVI